ncbi:MAG: TIGR01777 family oxidoreductase [Phycisphaerales bacterium]|nr:TIGR01777 family oxidoreductase [Phycisphaerales bacterium]
MRVAITGANGLVGRALIAALDAPGDQALALVRRSGSAGTSSHEIVWNPATARLDPQALDGVEAVVNLAGESIADGRWTDARKKAILDSRVLATDLISRTIAAMRRPPRVLISASAIGYYGARNEAPLDEDAPPGSGFLAEVCRAWESATQPAADAGVRIVNLRIGLVLAASGGALEKMLPIFKFGMGGIVGSGRQFMSWITLTDLLRAIRFAIERDHLRGAVNAVAPHAVTNRDFTMTLARVLHRPAIIPAPAFAIRAAMGEMGEQLLLSGANVRPKRLLDAGFSFSHPELDAALRHELGANR